MLKDDYLIRQIKQLGDAIATVLGLNSKERKEDYETAIDVVDETLEEVLGARLRLIESVDATTAVGLLDSPELVSAVADLYRHKAEACEGLGDDDSARRLRERAHQFLALLART